MIGKYSPARKCVSVVPNLLINMVQNAHSTMSKAPDQPSKMDSFVLDHTCPKSLGMLTHTEMSQTDHCRFVLRCTKR